MLQRVAPGDLLITMGAGDVSALGPLLLEELTARERGAASDDEALDAASHHVPEPSGDTSTPSA